MSTITQFAGRAPHRRAAIGGIAADAVTAFRSAFDRFRKGQAATPLTALSDAQLRDIGITRSDIALIVSGTDLDQVRSRHVRD